MDWNALWEIIKEVFAIIGDTSIFIITIYTFYLTFFPKLRYLGMSHKTSFFEGEDISISFENRGLSPISIDSVELVLDDYKVKIFAKKINDNCIIEGFKTLTVTMKPASAIETDDGVVSFDVKKRKYLIVKTSRNIQYIDIKGKKSGRALKRLEKRYPIKDAYIPRHTFDGVIITPHIKYAIIYIDKLNKVQSILVSHVGLMNSRALGFDIIPKEHLKSKNDLEKFLNKKIPNVKFGVEEMNKELGL